MTLSRVAAGFSFVIIFILLFMASCSSAKLAEKDGNMVSEMVIPDIDNLTTASIKTATFALG